MIPRQIGEVKGCSTVHADYEPSCCMCLFILTKKQKLLINCCSRELVASKFVSISNVRWRFTVTGKRGRLCFFMCRSWESEKVVHPSLFSCFFFLIHLKVIINQIVDTARQLSHLLVFCSSSIMVPVFWCMSSRDKRASWCSCGLCIQRSKFFLF